MLASFVAGRPWGQVILTARGSAWARTRGGCTACTGRRGRPGWPESPVLTTGQPLAAAGSQSSLKQHTHCLGKVHGPRAVLLLPVLGAKGLHQPNLPAPTREQHLLFRVSATPTYLSTPTGNNTHSSRAKGLHQPNLSTPTRICSSGAQWDHLTTGLPFSCSPLCSAAVLPLGHHSVLCG